MGRWALKFWKAVSVLRGMPRRNWVQKIQQPPIPHSPLYTLRGSSVWVPPFPRPREKDHDLLSNQGILSSRSCILGLRSHPSGPQLTWGSSALNSLNADSFLPSIVLL